MHYLRQSTASQEVLLGPFLDDTDGKTAETGLTIANTDIKLWVEGGTTEASKNSGGATHIAGGRYYAVLDATDTATLGKMEVNVHVSGALPVRREFMVLPANVYDSLVLGTDYLQSDAVEISGDSTAADNAELAFDGTGYGFTNCTVPAVTGNVGGNVIGSVGSVTGGINTSGGTITTLDALDTAQDSQHSTTQSSILNAAEIRSECIAAAPSIADAVWDEASTGHTDAGKAGAQLWTDIDAILEDTNELQTDLANGGRLDLLIDSIVTYVDCLPATLDGSTFTSLPDVTLADGAHGGASSSLTLSDYSDFLATSVTVSDKTGFKLASDGLDSVSTTAPTGLASNFREMLVQTWRRFYGKATRTATAIETYAADGTTVLTEQTISDDGTTETQGEASTPV